MIGVNFFVFFEESFVTLNFEEEFLSDFHDVLKYAIDLGLNVFEECIGIGKVFLELGSDEGKERLPHGVDFGVAFFFREELFEAEDGGFVKPVEGIVPAVNKFQSFDFKAFFEIEDVALAVPLKDFDGAKMRVEVLVFESELVF
jgi:hypothetical protein